MGVTYFYAASFQYLSSIFLTGVLSFFFTFTFFCTTFFLGSTPFCQPAPDPVSPDDHLNTPPPMPDSVQLPVSDWYYLRLALYVIPFPTANLLLTSELQTQNSRSHFRRSTKNSRWISSHGGRSCPIHSWSSTVFWAMPATSTSW